MGQMSAAEKHELSHRGKAARAMAEYLRGTDLVRGRAADRARRPTPRRRRRRGPHRPHHRPVRPRHARRPAAASTTRPAPSPDSGATRTSSGASRTTGSGACCAAGWRPTAWAPTSSSRRPTRRRSSWPRSTPGRGALPLVHRADDGARASSSTDARRALAPAPDALHVGTLGLTMEPVADSLAASWPRCPTETLVMVDPNCRPTATPDVAVYRERMTRVLGRADIVKGSDEDFAYPGPGRLDGGCRAVPARARRRRRHRDPRLGAGAGLVRRRRGEVPVPGSRSSTRSVPATPSAAPSWPGGWSRAWAGNSSATATCSRRRDLRRPRRRHQLHPRRRRAADPRRDGQRNLGAATMAAMRTIAG